MFLLDVSPEVGLNRIKSRKEKDRIEQEQIKFFQSVRSTYLQRAKKYSNRFRVIDANKVFSQVKKEVCSILSSYIKEHQNG